MEVSKVSNYSHAMEKCEVKLIRSHLVKRAEL